MRLKWNRFHSTTATRASKIETACFAQPPTIAARRTTAYQSNRLTRSLSVTNRWRDEFAQVHEIHDVCRVTVHAVTFVINSWSQFVTTDRLTDDQGIELQSSVWQGGMLAIRPCALYPLQAVYWITTISFKNVEIAMLFVYKITQRYCALFWHAVVWASSL